MKLKDDKRKSALNVRKGIEQPSPVDPVLAEKFRNIRPLDLSSEIYLDGIINGKRALLSKAITLVESSLPAHQEKAQQIIGLCLPYSGNSIRIGITGVPGVGKSTFIEALGKMLTAMGHRIAVLAIDPSSRRSKGSILGDKTRMEELANDPAAYIRPTSSAGTLGGVARKTREAIILCEAAGFDIIFVETVGVGQSETAVHSMVDFFLLLMLAGAGDELQGIKRGIMEMADAIVINKSDGDNVSKASQARQQYENALHLYPLPSSGWAPRVLTCSSVTKTGIEAVWGLVDEYVDFARKSGHFESNRKEQALQAMSDALEFYLKQDLYSNSVVTGMIKAFRDQILKDKLSPYYAAQKLFDAYLDFQKNRND